MPGGQRTRVYLTVDVECAEERLRGGVHSPPLGYDLRVWGRLRNQPVELGVPLLLRELSRAGLGATFFLEVFGSQHFGEAQFREVCQQIRDAGQDVQLHAHPVQRLADWHTRREQPVSDEIGTYDVDRQAALLREGIDILERCGIDRRSLLAFRAGHYAASNETWKAMRSAGLHLSSSFNLSYRGKTCRIRWPSEANALFRTDVEGVWELPVSNFREGPGRFRHLEICAVSFAEMRHYLLEARRLGVPEVTIVTHSFEFFFVDSPSGRRGRPNSVSIERLRQLLAFLGDRADLFEVETIGALARRLAGERSDGGVRGDELPVPEGRPLLRWGRHLQQARQRLSSKGRWFA